MSTPLTSVHTFHVLHIPTGVERIGTFNASHNEMFAEPNFVAFYTLANEKHRLINSWNRQQPTTWKYWI